MLPKEVPACRCLVGDAFAGVSDRRVAWRGLGDRASDVGGSHHGDMAANAIARDGQWTGSALDSEEPKADRPPLAGRSTGVGFGVWSDVCATIDRSLAATPVNDPSFGSKTSVKIACEARVAGSDSAEYSQA